MARLLGVGRISQQGIGQPRFPPERRCHSRGYFKFKVKAAHTHDDGIPELFASVWPKLINVWIYDSEVTLSAHMH